jgi:hypothetical protein
MTLEDSVTLNLDKWFGVPLSMHIREEETCTMSVLSYVVGQLNLKNNSTVRIWIEKQQESKR